jgi:hypothetical protein
MPVKHKDDPTAVRLARVRGRLGWSQSRMGAYLGVTRATISTWEAHGPPVHGPARTAIGFLLTRLVNTREYQRRGQELRLEMEKSGETGNEI